MMLHVCLNLDLIAAHGPHPWLDWLAGRQDVPRALAPLASGQTSTTCSLEDWLTASTWAAAGPGWPSTEEAPVYIVHPAEGADFSTVHLQGLGERVQAGAEALIAWAARGLGRRPRNGGARVFYGPCEWRSRHRSVASSGALLVVEHESGDLKNLDTMADLPMATYQELESELKALGLFLEPLTSTACALYDLPGEQSAPSTPAALSETVPACVERLTIDELRRLVREMRTVLWGTTDYDPERGEYLVLDPEREFDVDDLDQLAGLLKSYGCGPEECELP